MLPLMLALYVGRLGEAGAPLQPRIAGETANHLGYLDTSLTGRDWLMGDALTGADVQMSFVGEMAVARHQAERFPALAAWVKRFKARPAYQAAIARGGPYAF